MVFLKRLLSQTTNTFQEYIFTMVLLNHQDPVSFSSKGENSMPKFARLHILLPKWIIAGLVIASLFAVAVPGVALAGEAPVKEEYFICPTVSLNNSNGMWVTGAHGSYYVIVPTQGGINNNSRVFLTVPVTVPSLAQVPAGWGLYKDLPTFPNFEGMTVLLSEGISTWLGSPVNWEEFDMANVVNNGDGTYTVQNLTRGDSVTINQPIPLASAAVW